MYTAQFVGIKVPAGVGATKFVDPAKDIPGLKALGHDGIIGPSEESEWCNNGVIMNYIPFDASQIRSTLAFAPC